MTTPTYPRPAPLGLEGWIDKTEIQSPTNRQLPEGGYAILECRPRMAAAPSAVVVVGVSWQRNGVQFDESDPFPFHRKLDAWSLLAWNLSGPSHHNDTTEEKVRYKCSVELEYFGGVMGEVTRSFNLTLSEGECFDSDCSINGSLARYPVIQILY